MSIFDKIAQAKDKFQKEPYLRDGRYELVCRELLVIDEAAKQWVVCSFFVKSSAQAIPDVGVIANPAGSRCRRSLDLFNDRYDYHKNELKEIIQGLFGMPIPSTELGATLKEIVATKAAEGRTVACVTSRKEGKTFTNYAWRAIAQTDADVAKAKAGLPEMERMAVLF